MTAGGLIALVLYDRSLGVDAATDPAVVKGVAWIREHLDLAENPRLVGRWHLYRLWGLVLLERELPASLRPQPLWSKGVERFLTEGKPFDTSCCGSFDPKIDLAFLAAIELLLKGR